MMDGLRERVALWFRIPTMPDPLMRPASQRGASRDRRLAGKPRIRQRRAR